MRTILVLGSTVEPDGVGGWRTSKSDAVGVVDSSWRIHAAAHLYHEHRCVLVVLAGTAQTPSGPVSVTSVMKEELMRLGVTPGNIIEDDGCGSTYEQLVRGAKFLDEHRVVAGIGKIGILSSEWHLPRIQTMLHAPLDKYPQRPVLFQNRSYELIGAEAVLVQKDQYKWLEPVSKARSSFETLKRISMEADGIKQIMEGTYRL